MSKFLEWGDYQVRKSRIYAIHLEKKEFLFMRKLSYDIDLERDNDPMCRYAERDVYSLEEHKEVWAACAKLRQKSEPIIAEYQTRKKELQQILSPEKQRFAEHALCSVDKEKYPDVAEYYARLRELRTETNDRLREIYEEVCSAIRHLRFRYRVVLHAEEPGTEDRESTYDGNWTNEAEAIQEWRELAENL